MVSLLVCEALDGTWLREALQYSASGIDRERSEEGDQVDDRDTEQGSRPARAGAVAEAPGAPAEEHGAEDRRTDEIAATGEAERNDEEACRGRREDPAHDRVARRELARHV